jgi:hypothetical protein
MVSHSALASPSGRSFATSTRARELQAEGYLGEIIEIS